MRALIVAALLTLIGGVAAGAQRISDTRVASAAVDPLAAGDSAKRDTVDHPTGSRIAAALGLGFVTGFAMVPVQLCGTCVWDLRPAAAGVFAGMVLGSALIHAPHCSLSKRLKLSFIGTAAGTVVSLLVAKKSYLAKDGAASVATVVAGGAPVVGGVMALRRCD